MSLPEGPHRRYNPLLDEWVLVSPHRIDRPWKGRAETVSRESRPQYDPNCYLCPRNARAPGEQNPDYRATFVFDNDYPALSASPGDEHTDDDLLQAESEKGICRVMAFSPRHDLTFARMDLQDVRRIVDAWADETLKLAARGDLAHVQIFENRGELMGSSNPHPHAQIWASEHVPTIPARKLDAFTRYRSEHGTDLLGDYLARELQEGVRVLFSGEDWTAIVPFWAVWPFEVMLIPSRRVKDLPSLSVVERERLAVALQRLVTRYDVLFNCEFPYTMTIAQAPTDGKAHEEWRLHISFLPPLLRSATVKKFYVGYELSAEAQRDLTPEAAAERLRSVSEGSGESRESVA
jgi:UDPglucose--hexose-1-phosphate uridylyltransferase